MNTAFAQKEYCLRTSDFNRYKRLHPNAILDIFQDIAGIHANTLGCGHDTLLERSMIWVLVRVRYEVLCQPKMFDTVTALTWPLAPTRAGFRREYLLKDSKGNIVVKGSSEWVMMHSTERRLLPSCDVYPSDYDFMSNLAIEGKSARIHDFEAAMAPVHFTPQFSDIDMNGHVNNTKYANFVFNAVELSENEQIRCLQIDYKHEVLAGDSLDIYTAREDNVLLSKGMGEDGTIRFFCRAEIENI